MLGLKKMAQTMADIVGPQSRGQPNPSSNPAVHAAMRTRLNAVDLKVRAQELKLRARGKGIEAGLEQGPVQERVLGTELELERGREVAE